MPRTILDLHVLQTVPPSNLNRDDTGSPKTARFGGVTRARVSSQAWKRATRTAFGDLLDRSELGVRSKRLAELVGDEIARLDPSLDVLTCQKLAADAVGATGIKLTKPKAKKDAPEGKQDLPEESGYLVFLSRRQVTGLAELAVQAHQDGGKVTKADARAQANSEHSVDVALFGRMVADVTDLNVDAAAQVAHAVSVHAVENEYDYFTAVDDHKQADADEDAGAGMIGTVEFNSSTLYRYATVDVDRLHDTLGDAKATQRAVEAFTRAFVLSMPTGKQNTFANRTLPDAVLVVLRETQSINLVGAFEEAITTSHRADTPSRIDIAVQRLADHATEVQAAFDETPVAAWTYGPGDRLAPLTTIATRGTADTTTTALGETVAARLA